MCFARGRKERRKFVNNYKDQPTRRATYILKIKTVSCTVFQILSQHRFRSLDIAIKELVHFPPNMEIPLDP